MSMAYFELTSFDVISQNNIYRYDFNIIFFSFIFSIDIDNKYIDVLSAVEEAKNESLKGGNCAKYNW